MIHRIGQWFVFILFLGLAFGYPFSHELKWSYYETEHFRLYYTHDTATVAGQAFDIVEPIFSEVTRTLGYIPPDKVELVFTDQDDQANGYADYFSNMIVIEVSPISQSMLGPFRKPPLYNLIAHELTHIVHLGMNNATPLVYRLTKRLSSKGFLYPQFMVEGQAVYDEKYLAQGGRLLGSAFEEQMMAFAKAKSFPTLAQITNRQMLRWPHGNGPYIIGAKFIDYLVNQYGRTKLMDIYHEFSGESYLGGFEGAFESVIKEPLPKVYQSFQDYQYLRYLNCAKQEAPSVILQTGPQMRDQLSLSGSDRLVWYENDFHTPARIVAMTLQSSEPPQTILEDPLLIGKALVDEGSLYFLRYDQASLYQTQQELVRKIGVQETVIAEHVNDFDVADGAILWVKSVGSGEVLMLTDVKGTTSQILTADAMTSPLLMSSKQAYIALRTGLDNKLILIDIPSGSRQVILSVPVRDLSKTPSSDLIFVSDINGLSQAFLFDQKTKMIKQLTHEVTGVYSPVLTSSGLVYLTLTDMGRDLVSVSPDEQIVKVSDLLIAPAVPEPTWNVDVVPTPDRRVLRTDLFKPVFRKTPQDYDAFSYNLLYIVPYVTFSSYGNYVGFNMMMADPLQYQQLAMTFMSNAGVESYQVQYLNTWLYPFFSYQAKKQNGTETSTLELQLPWIWGGRYMQQLSAGIDHTLSDSENDSYWKFSHSFQIGDRFLYSLTPENSFQNQASYFIRQTDQKTQFVDQINLYLPGMGQNHVVHFDATYANSQTGTYSLGGFMNSLSVRGYPYGDIIEGQVAGRMGLEYVYPIGVIDDATWFFGLYGYQTYGTIFADVGDANTPDLFGKEPYYSYGYLWGIKSIAANMYPLSLGLGLAHTGKADLMVIFSFGMGL